MGSQYEAMLLLRQVVRHQVSVRHIDRADEEHKRGTEHYNNEKRKKKEKKTNGMIGARENNTSTAFIFFKGFQYVL